MTEIAGDFYDFSYYDIEATNGHDEEFRSAGSRICCKEAKIKLQTALPTLC